MAIFESVAVAIEIDQPCSCTVSISGNESEIDRDTVSISGNESEIDRDNDTFECNMFDDVNFRMRRTNYVDVHSQATFETVAVPRLCHTLTHNHNISVRDKMLSEAK
jgi:hypothetical protein